MHTVYTVYVHPLGWQHGMWFTGAQQAGLGE